MDEGKMIVNALSVFVSLFYLGCGIPTEYITYITIYNDQVAATAAFASEACHNQHAAMFPVLDTVAKLQLYNTLRTYRSSEYGNIASGFWINAYKGSDQSWYWDRLPDCSNFSGNSSLWANTDHDGYSDCVGYGVGVEGEYGLLSYPCTTPRGLIVCENVSTDKPCVWNIGPYNACIESDSNYMIHGTFDLETCKDECANVTVDNMECWAIEYAHSTKECKLFVHSNPLLLTDVDTSTVDCPGTEIHHRNCYRIQSIPDKINPTNYCSGQCTLQKSCTTSFTAQTISSATTESTYSPEDNTATSAYSFSTTDTPNTTPGTTKVTAPLSNAASPSTTPGKTKSTSPLLNATTYETTTAQSEMINATAPVENATGETSTAPPLTTISTPSTTLTASQESSQTTSSNVNRIKSPEERCTCDCSTTATLRKTQLTQGELELLLKQLSIDKKKTSLSVRAKTSAYDDRPSARAIGWVGVLCLCIFGLIILINDALNLSMIRKAIRCKKP